MRSIFLTLSLFFSCIVNAQVKSSFIGSWMGKLNVGPGLRIVLHIEPAGDGQYSATLDSPDQQVNGIKTEGVIVSGDSIRINIPSINGRIAGRMVNDSTISASLYQGGPVPVSFRRMARGEAVQGPARPQTPQPPFPYRADSVVYKSRDGKLTYGATITIPNGKGPFPSIILITGSGAQDRDENILGHRMFAVLSDMLTRNGYLVLRADDRGVGVSTGDFNMATSADFAADVKEHLYYLQQLPQVDTKRIGLLGHSEGGMIAPMVAAERKDLAFLILLAAPGVPVVQLMAEQNIAVLRSAGLDSNAATTYGRFFRDAVPALVKAPTKDSAVSLMANALKEWRATTHPNIVMAATGVRNDSTAKGYVNTMVNSLYTPWYRYFISFDPQPWLARVKTKVLALNGERDIQVLAASNLEGIRKGLGKARNKDFTIRYLPGLNHLFQTCKSCSLNEYGQLTETISPAALDVIREWLLEKVPPVKQ
ncbi:alpha/beta fold hydrolase [Flavihumibacter rivuli]|uniref:alpha/beta hydrolase family protein n=1 Tax=Flavihumibacter rivuli TaxID=2838156 RepID=UPI001BDEBDC2|nr:alpha/beta fold hydrolase [Flavihumibacter rivuli]ULQ55739.1 alpha/beta fold hydrolase [Flavihumibacter rivuli]